MRVNHLAPALALALTCVMLLAGCQTQPSPGPAGSVPVPGGTSAVQSPDPGQSGGSAQLPGEDGPDWTPTDNKTLYVLMYHSLVEGDGQGLNDWMLTTDRFREDLRWLADNGYTTVLPREVAQMGALPEKAVMLTFDDGYADNYRLALPILEEFQAKATVAMIVRRTVDEKPDFLTWDMAREMTQSGLVELGSHTYDSHRSDPRGIQRMEGESRKEYAARVLADLQLSIDLIEENVGTEVGYFAHPHGQLEPWAEDFLAEHFYLTVTSVHDTADISGGLHGLSRYNISMSCPPSKYLP